MSAEDIRLEDAENGEASLIRRSSYDEHDGEGEGAGASPGVPGFANGLHSFFSGDATDLILINAYNTAVLFFDASTDPNNPTHCTSAQQGCIYFLYFAVLALYIFYHYWRFSHDQKGGTHTYGGYHSAGNIRTISQHERWYHVGRFLIFATFLISIHGSPIACGIKKDQLSNLRYAQATLIVLASLCASVGTKLASRPKQDDDNN